VKKSIPITESIRAALDAVQTAERGFAAGADSYSTIELPKLALAEAVLDAVKQQRLDRLPTRAVEAVVEVEMRPKRRRRPA
jgi:hypothetical protein